MGHIKELYFDWLVDKITSEKQKRKYSLLLEYLFVVKYDYILEMDQSRAEDGIELRYRFGEESEIPLPEIAYYIDNKDCRCLEMMVALSLKCHESFMSSIDDDENDGVKRWFWEMIYNLGLNEFSDSRFDPVEVDYILQQWMKRKYEKNGKGGLFITNDETDMRKIEIWRQMCIYLNIIIEDLKDG